VASAIERYFGDAKGAQPGEHTIIVRKAIAQVQRRQKRRYAGWITALALCALGAGAYAWRLHNKAAEQRASALEIFYAIKSLDVDIAGVEKMVRDSGSVAGEAEVSRYRERRQNLERSYDKFLAGLNVYDPKATPQQRLILRVARIFGESEIAMPPEFAAEIDSYIKKWKSSDRFEKAIAAGSQSGMIPVIAKELLANGLPPQFLYLALQESNFDPYTSGPKTHSGIAKGMWQFMPETAVKYGLKLGPLVDLPRPDPADDRHHWDLETDAAAAYLKDLYQTDAEASGLLVMACYNWGEDRMLPLIRKMPANPRERNFWKLLAGGKERIPQETYEYVLYIVSAAVIGEDPKLFGFEFDNPLGFLERGAVK
jgi:hypothetical protein